MATTFEGNLGRGTILIESGNLVWTDEDAGTISWRAVDGGGSSAVVDSGAGAITITSHQGDLFWAHIDAGAMLSRLSPATSSAFDGGFTNVASLRTITVGSTDTDRSRIFAMNTAGLITFSDIATNERGTIGDGGRALEVGTETGGKCACWASGNQVNCYSDKLGQASLLDAGGAPTALAWGQSSLFRARLFVLFGTELRMFEDTGSHLYCSQITWGAATNVASNVSALASDGRAAFYATGSIGYKVDSTMSTGVPVGAFNGTCTSIAADRVTNTAFCRNVNGIVRFP